MVIVAMANIPRGIAMTNSQVILTKPEIKPVNAGSEQLEMTPTPVQENNLASPAPTRDNKSGVATIPRTIWIGFFMRL